MSRSRYQQRLNTCSAMLLAALLLIIVLVQWTLSRREPPPLEPPTPTLIATFISREAIAVLPTNTPYLDLKALPTFTTTPTITPTPTLTPTPTATLTPTATPIPTFVAQVGIELVNVRSGPGEIYEIVTILGEGEQVVVTGKMVGDEWVLVEMETGETGWIFAEFLSAAAEIDILQVLTPPPTPTPAPVTATPTRRPPTATPVPVALAAAVAPNQARVPRLVLANYFTWFDNGSWDACNISAGDSPLQRYHSDDAAAIARHVQLAQNAGIDGFTAQWASPGDRTDRNFATLLAQSTGTNFQSTVVFLRHIWPGATNANTVEALRYILQQYGNHPNFLRVQGRPVVFITDVYRVPRAEGVSAQAAWANIRAQVDPNKTAWWIAEGLDASFLATFDGLWVYKVSHADYPNDYVKSTRWANNARGWEQRTGEAKLWVGTLMPGWDDTRAGCRPDIRVPSAPFARSRDGGNFYRATYNAAVQSNPDILWIHSFNEWVEGSYIEPSRFYGDAYLNLTRELGAQFRGG